MGERSDELTRSSGHDDTQDRDSSPVIETRADVVSTSGVTDETQQIQMEIEQTRSEMSATIDAIQAKLSPDTLKEQAKEAVREVAEHAAHEAKEAVRDAADHAKEAVRDATVGKAERMVYNVTETANEAQESLVDTIRQNPVPSLLAALSIGWLYMNRRSGSSNTARTHPSRSRYTSRSTSYYRPERDTYSGERVRYDESEGGMLDQAKEKVRDVASTAREKVGDIADQTQERASEVADQAQDTLGRVVEVIQENPVPAAITAVGLGWLVMNSRSGSRSTYRYPQRDYSYRGRYFREDDSDRGIRDTVSDAAGTAADRVGNAAGTVRNTVGDAASTARDTVTDAAGTVKDTVGDAAGSAANTVSNVASTARDKVGDIADQTQEKAGRMANRAQYEALKMEYRVQERLQENPLAVGAVAFALGAAVGLAVPGTQREQQLMGTARDKLVDKAQEVAQGTLEKVQGVVDEAKDTATEAAKEQGLIQE